MVKNCVVSGCRNVWRPNQGINYHRFPMNRPEILKQWVEVVRLENFKPNKHTAICSAHFTKDSYSESTLTKKRLKPDAVPSIFDFPIVLIVESIDKLDRSSTQKELVDDSCSSSSLLIEDVSKEESEDVQLQVSCLSSPPLFVSEDESLDDSCSSSPPVFANITEDESIDVQLQDSCLTSSQLFADASTQTWPPRKVACPEMREKSKKIKILQQRLKRRDSVIKLLKQKMKCSGITEDITLKIEFDGKSNENEATHFDPRCWQ